MWQSVTCGNIFPFDNNWQHKGHNDKSLEKGASISSRDNWTTSAKGKDDMISDSICRIFQYRSEYEEWTGQHDWQNSGKRHNQLPENLSLNSKKKEKGNKCDRLLPQESSSIRRNPFDIRFSENKILSVEKSSLLSIVNICRCRCL